MPAGPMPERAYENLLSCAKIKKTLKYLKPLLRESSYVNRRDDSFSIPLVCLIKKPGRD